MRSSNKKAILLLAITLIAGTMLKAQSYNTNERLIDQIMKGTVPGRQFNRSQKTVAKEIRPTAVQQNESLITQIRKGTAPNMKFRPGGSMMRAATPAAATKPAVAKKGPLASELEVPKTENKTVPAPVIPSQEEQQ